MHRLLLLGALVTAACGGSKGSSPTQPSPASVVPTAPAAPVVVYTSLGSMDSRDNPIHFPSSSTYARVGDDFTPTVTAEVRSIVWDGAYCDPRFQVPLAIPPAAAGSFRVTLSADSGFDTVGFPPLYDVVFEASQVRQEHQFDILESSWGCGAKVPAPVAFYRFSATLPTAFSVIAGRKYWLEVSADTDASGLGWGWRPSTPGRSWIRFYNATYAWNMSFSLTSQ